MRDIEWLRIRPVVANRHTILRLNTVICNVSWVPKYVDVRMMMMLMTVVSMCQAMLHVHVHHHRYCALSVGERLARVPQRRDSQFSPVHQSMHKH